jgi:hypothetical protein
LRLVVPNPDEVLVCDARDAHRPGIDDRLVRNLLNRDRDVSRDVRLGVLPVVHLEPQVVLPVSSTVFHRDHPRVLVQLEPGVFGRFPVELLVGEVPVVQIVHVHPPDLGLRRLTLIVVHEDLLRARLHLVVVHVPDHHREGAGAAHGRISVVLDDDRDQILLLLLPVEGPQRRDDRHAVTVGALCNQINIRELLRTLRLQDDTIWAGRVSLAPER